MWIAGRMAQRSLACGHRLWKGAEGNRRFSTRSHQAREFSPGSRDLLDSRCEFLDEVVHTPVFANQSRDVRRGIDDGRVVTTAEMVSDLG